MFEFLKKKKKDFYCLADGVVKSVTECKDPAFSKKMMGVGIVIDPEDGRVYAPCDGKVSMIFPTKHAMGLITDESTEILIHFGIDTVNLKEDCFQLFVNENEQIKCGDCLMQGDLKTIEKNGLSNQIIMVFPQINDECRISIHEGYKTHDEIAFTLNR